MNSRAQGLMLESGRTKLLSAFQFLQSLNDLRNPPRREISLYDFKVYLRETPEHPNVQGPCDDFVLKVKRIDVTPCPAVTPLVADWLMPGWDKPGVRPTAFAQRGQGLEVELFNADSTRVEEFASWLALWDRWAPVRRIEEAVERLYQALYEQHSVLERDAERYELLLGDGFVRWALPEGPVNHPVLLVPVELMFAPERAEFTIVESQRPVEFFSSPLYSEEVDAHKLAKVRMQLSERPEIHPLDEIETTAFLRGFAASLSESGKFYESPPNESTSGPCVFRSLTIFRRNRSVGLSQAIRQVIDDLATDPSADPSPSWMECPPEGLMRFMGIETRPPIDGESSGEPPIPPEFDETIFFTKPANHEQYQIVRKLRATGCVLVQGPPGTGKTHTIGNLVGHLLAEGKSVLVTSHTTKALSVVTEKVAEPLQPLCVSVLDSDVQNRSRMEHAVYRMSEKLSVGRDSYARRASELGQVRSRLLGRLRDLRTRLRIAQSGEYELLAYRGESFTPINAAKLVAREESEHSWIPGDVVEQDYPPLSKSDFFELYGSNASISAVEERNYPDRVPDVGLVPSPDAYAATLHEVLEFRKFQEQVPTTIVTRPLTVEKRQFPGDKATARSPVDRSGHERWPGSVRGRGERQADLLGSTSESQAH